MKTLSGIVSRSIAILLLAIPIWAHAADKPNIVLILMDNFAWAEVGAYGGGILRGAPTPNIVSMATTSFCHL